ncbi:hypothetical protein MNEG_10835, partial [Monoraphidium neglectum]
MAPSSDDGAAAAGPSTSSGVGASRRDSMEDLERAALIDRRGSKSISGLGPGRE